MELSHLKDIDRNHIWHPYTSITNPPIIYPVSHAEGVHIHLMDGRQLIDGMSSWWCAIHGYNVPQLNEAARKQIDKMSHVMFGGLTHEPAVELAERLLGILPPALNKIFFADSGSIAVEVAMKMAIQYHAGCAHSPRSKFATIRSGYHGDTWHAMSVCDPVNGMHGLFGSSLPVQFFLPQPKSRYGHELAPQDLEPLHNLLNEHGTEIAALILEPVVQGAGGMFFYAPQYLREASKICMQHGVLLIFDEIATGFGRTGCMFALEHAQVVPDIICIGKALTGGYMTLSATIAQEHIAQGISQSPSPAFMHGPTFMANPLACAVACASIDQLLSSPWKARVQKIEMDMNTYLLPLKKMKGVADVRVLGAIGVVELDDPVDMQCMQPMFVDAGVWVRPFGKLVYIMPAYIISEDEIRFLCEAIVGVVSEYLQKQT
ncbi:adenosylmethionine--8-amino-7-oxononanoate transaminase [Taylorella equigenitalis]|uniref:Adenosylmethionine-8-amino-7-oxononanoate aminotransferase n=1 Tax=Taylorella equigenitalis (strain MCE9) TaxID=937774 RepID=A0A654KHE1_TAYEM|nr:adenosylmethionine--8-amino-7-oxononanoate transaminase [Taylorella equigenitalis]ADU91822.1 Adenosylmethionine-8-amino-7-oxononanoate aminotransferase [Taylorella equigenitalis MCE9]WDU48123.1 adenosylmethionine--8-amino-7-oxononanoate transaminase [Taylorella equigenitalis]WDU49632.1 adenosylmethionine--8-amino-7-oxononanoate transaminase [Taylorella equigenitalis]WDU53616.1 adenosylmethionine--8-amino-7-oxononanoate transaminase [Taylorella equigenitalis]WDU56601.1 adenosylmethionine--8-